MSDFSFFIPLAKVDKETRCVSGYASTPTKDLDGEVITLDAVKAALPSYMEWRNIREMHRLSAVGTAQEAHVDSRGLFLTAKIVDEAAWQKCLDGVYKGFSIGGRKIEKVGNKVTEIDLTEISIVDRPCNPDCRLALAKRAKDITDGVAGHLLKVQRAGDVDKALAKLAKSAAKAARLAKEGPLAAHDGFSLPAKPSVNVSPKDPDMELNKDGSIGSDGEPYGDVEYADPGYQGDKKKRYPLDSEKHIRAAWSYIGQGKNAKQYSAEQVSHIKAKIVAAWKSKIDPKGPPKATRTAKTLDFLDLRKAPTPKGKGFLQLRTAPPKESEVVSDMDDINDYGDFFTSLFGKESLMTTQQQHEPDDLTKVLATLMTGGAGGVKRPIAMTPEELVKAARSPSRAQRFAMVGAHMKKARRARKAAASAVEDCHKMLKAAYMSKAARKAAGKGDGDPDDEDFDKAEAMSKLQKAFGEMEKMKTFMKAAEAQLEKLARGGERGQETADGAPHYRVPPGVEDMTPDEMARMGPGGGDGSGMPPENFSTSMFPGKAAGNGVITQAHADLLVKNAKMEGELEALRRLPASVAGARRPMAFDMSRMGGGGDAETRATSEALFKGVEPGDLQRDPDDPLRAKAAATIVGNMLLSGRFGKSMIDPSFHGTAGAGH